VEQFSLILLERDITSLDINVLSKMSTNSVVEVCNASKYSALGLVHKDIDPPRPVQAKADILRLNEENDVLVHVAENVNETRWLEPNGAFVDKDWHTVSEALDGPGSCHWRAIPIQSLLIAQGGCISAGCAREIGICSRPLAEGTPSHTESPWR
jgi:hypothetical protein